MITPNSSKPNMKYSIQALSCQRIGETTDFEWKMNGQEWINTQNKISCEEYATCGRFKGENAQVGAVCHNSGSGFNDNCDRLVMNCPDGMKPSAEYVECKRYTKSYTKS